MKKLLVLLIGIFFVHNVFAEVEIILPDIPEEIRWIPKMTEKELALMKPQTRKRYNAFKVKLEEHLEAVDKIMSGKIKPTCQNINKMKKVLYPPKIKNDVEEFIVAILKEKERAGRSFFIFIWSYYLKYVTPWEETRRDYNEECGYDLYHEMHWSFEP